jgi:hypothetical protein
MARTVAVADEASMRARGSPDIHLRAERSAGMHVNRHTSAALLAVLGLGAGLAARLTEDRFLEDAGLVVIVVTLVILAVEVPRIVLGRDARRGMGRS